MHKKYQSNTQGIQTPFHIMPYANSPYTLLTAYHKPICNIQIIHTTNG